MWQYFALSDNVLLMCQDEPDAWRYLCSIQGIRIPTKGFVRHLRWSIYRVRPLSSTRYKATDTISLSSQLAGYNIVPTYPLQERNALTMQDTLFRTIELAERNLKIMKHFIPAPT